MRLLLLAFTLLPLIVLGQRGFVSPAFDLGVPNDRVLKSIAGTGYGGSFGYDHRLSNRLAATGSFGTLSFSTTTVPGMTTTGQSINVTSKVNMTWLQAGSKFFLSGHSTKQKGLYIGAGLGVHVLTLAFLYRGSRQAEQGTYFSYSIGAGYRYRKLDLSYRQQLIQYHQRSLNYNGFRIAYALQRS